MANTIILNLNGYKNEDRENISNNNNRSNGSPRAAAPLIRKVTMKQKGLKEKKEPLRKEGKQRGVTTQKMMSFRVDNELVEWLDSQPNKGRLINQLLFNEKSRQEGMP